MWPSSSLGVAALLGLQRGRGEGWDRGTALNAAALLDAHLPVEIGGAPASTARAPAGDVGEVGMGHRLAGAALGTERKVEGGNGVGTKVAAGVRGRCRARRPPAGTPGPTGAKKSARTS